LHLLEQEDNHPIVRFAYLCHMIGKDYGFVSFLYIKLFELGLELAFNNRPRLPTTKSICSNFHFGAPALSAPMKLLCYSFAFAFLCRRKAGGCTFCLLLDTSLFEILLILPFIMP